MSGAQTEELLHNLDRVHQRTMRVVRCIPAERLEYSFDATRFSLGDMVRHIAAINRYMFAETAAGRPSGYAGHGIDLADGLDAVIRYIEEKQAETMAILRSLGPERFDEKCRTPEGTPITVWKWLRAMAEHEAHHRGQIYFCLGLLGVPTPPLYGLTSEQVRAMTVEHS